MIEIVYTNGEKIFINLFDTNVVKKISNCFGTEFKERYYIRDCSDNPFHNDYDGRYHNIEEIKTHWNSILDGLQGMKQLGNEINISFDSTFDFSQETLNTLHRIFTYVDLYYDNMINEYPYCDNYTNDVGISFEEYHHIVDKINVGVHSLESWVKPTDNTLFILDNHIMPRIQYCTKDYSTFQSKWCEFDTDEYKENFNFLKYNHENIVTLTDNILGKSPLISFRDDDNPTLPDCTGRFATEGSFQINKGTTLQDFYKSNYFENWANNYGKTKHELPLEIAIGYVNLEKTTQNIDYFWNRELEVKYVSWL